MKEIKRYIVLVGILLLLLPFNGFADSFVRVRVSKKTVYPTEPLTLSIRVLTSTWFTRAPDLYDLQIPNSFTYRMGRPLIGSEDINGTRYSYLDFQFSVFPAVIGEIEIAPIPIEFETPDSGDYKGKKKRIKTKPIRFSVRQIPENYTGADWVIANNIRLSERWQGLKDTLLVGDVLYRTFSVKGSGIPKALLPRIKQDSINLGSVYTKSPTREMSISEEGLITSSYTETVTILLEKSGELEIPAVEYNFWDLQSKKQITRKLKARTVYVKENPNLAMLQTLQDSLNAETKIVKAKELLTILGFSPFQFGALIVLLLAVGVFLIRYVQKLVRKYKAYRLRYLKSEKYAYKQVRKACRDGNTKEVYNKVNVWYLQNKKQEASPSLKEQSLREQSTSLYNAVSKVDKAITNGKSSVDTKSLSGGLEAFRKKMLQPKQQIQGKDLNPK